MRRAAAWFSLALVVGGCGAELTQTLAPPPYVDRDDGQAAPVGSGRAFVVSDLELLGPACTPGLGCASGRFTVNGLGGLINDQLRQGLLGGESLTVLELTGIDRPDVDTDTRMEVRVYRAGDADSPFYPGNNFAVREDETTCCEYEVAADGLDDARRPRHVLRGQRDRGALEASAPQDSSVAINLFWLESADGTLGRSTIELTGVRLVGRLGQRSPEERGPRPETLEDLLLTGTWTLQALATTPTPYCRPQGVPFCGAPGSGPSSLNMLLFFTQPDVDLDGDGLERVETDALGTITGCLDGSGAVVPPLEPGRPETCALSPRMADGYAMQLKLRALSATIVRVGP
jgi:hypothetical protein